MPRPPTQWPEIIFAADGARAALAKAATEGRIVRIGPGIYSGRPRGREAEMVRHNWAQILAHEYPGAIITDRSARRNGPDHELLTIVHPRRRRLELPGLTILPRSGAGSLPGDIPGDAIWFASQPRGLIENLRGRGHRRYLTTPEIEAWLADIVATSGTRHLNWIRDQAGRLPEQAGWERAFKRLDGIIGAVLSTHSIDALETPALWARAAGIPFDHRRLALLEQLAQHLGDTPPEPLPLLEVDADRRRLLPFYEAYFSNFIEGTEFTLDEAAAIVFDHQVPANRPQDAHDILGTYRIVADERERARTPQTADELIAILASRHRELMGARPDKRPGRFKEQANRAGATTFVAPELVEETLRRGFDAAVNLLDPFARGVYVGFLVAEVHPFDDGNGRISRMAMNAELSRAAEGRIVIPTVYRNNYLAALRGATHNGAFDSLVAALRFAQRYTARIDFSSRRTAEADLVRTNALRDPNEADEVGVRLRLPD